MGGLGMAAGAFEGDNARAEQAARRAGLRLQAAALSQQNAHFNENKRIEREQMAQAKEDKAQWRVDNLAQSEKRMSLEERQFKSGQENDLYQKKRADWQDAITAENRRAEIESKKAESRKMNADYEEMQRLRRQGEEARANKTKLVESAAGLIIRSAVENGVASPEELSVFSKVIGKQVDQAYPVGDGSVVMRFVEGVDKQTGQPIFKERPFDPTIVSAVLEKFKDPFDDRKSDVPTTGSAFFKQQEIDARNANAQNDAAIRSNGTPRKLSYSEKVKIDLEKEAIKKMNDELEGVEDPKFIADTQAKIDARIAKIEAIETGAGVPAATPQGNGGGAAVEPPDVAAERARLTKIARQTKKPAEQQAYVDSGLAKFKPAATAEPSGQADGNEIEQLNKWALTQASGDRTKARELFIAEYKRRRGAK